MPEPEPVPEPSDESYEEYIQTCVMHEGHGLLEAFGRGTSPEDFQWLFDCIDEHGLAWVYDQARQAGTAV